MPNLKQFQIAVDVDALPAHTDEQLEEWVRYETGQSFEIDSSNPLCECELEVYACHSI